MDEIEKRARKFLAAELDIFGFHSMAAEVRDEDGDNALGQAMIRAVTAAIEMNNAQTIMGIPVVFDESLEPGTFELRKHKPKLIGWRMADYTYETADRAVARGWACKVRVLPIFEGDPNTEIDGGAE